VRDEATAFSVARQSARLNALIEFLAQLDVPISEVDEMLPAFLELEAEVHLDERPPSRSLWLPYEVHSGFLGGAIGLARVAFNARADNVFPRCRPSPIARNNMVKVQVFPIKNAPAILAGVLVALEDVVARELDLFLRQAIKHEQKNHLRDSDSERNCVDAGFTVAVAGKMPPLSETVRLKRAVL